MDQQEEDADPDIVQKSRAKKRKSQQDDSDQEMQEARPTKKARFSNAMNEKETPEEEKPLISDAGNAEPPQKIAGTGESKSTPTADGTKNEPASLPRTPVNKKKSEKQRKRKSDSDEESGYEKMASTPPVLKVHGKIMMFCLPGVLITFVWQNGSGVQDKNAEGISNGEETLAEAAEVRQLYGDVEIRHLYDLIS